MPDEVEDTDANNVLAQALKFQVGQSFLQYIYFGLVSILYVFTLCAGY